jgi:hypothetical protein
MYVYIFRFRSLQPMQLIVDNPLTAPEAVELLKLSGLDGRHVVAARCIHEIGLPELGKSIKYTLYHPTSSKPAYIGNAAVTRL